MTGAGNQRVNQVLQNPLTAVTKPLGTTSTLQRFRSRHSERWGIDCCDGIRGPGYWQFDTALSERSH